MSNVEPMLSQNFLHKVENTCILMYMYTHTQIHTHSTHIKPFWRVRLHFFFFFFFTFPGAVFASRNKCRWPDPSLSPVPPPPVTPFSLHSDTEFVPILHFLLNLPKPTFSLTTQLMLLTGHKDGLCSQAQWVFQPSSPLFSSHRLAHDAGPSFLHTFFQWLDFPVSAWHLNINVPKSFVPNLFLKQSDLFILRALIMMSPVVI